MATTRAIAKSRRRTDFLNRVRWRVSSAGRGSGCGAFLDDNALASAANRIASPLGSAASPPECLPRGLPQPVMRVRQPCLKFFILVAVPARLELATFGLGNRCSIRLSYGTRTWFQRLDCARGTFEIADFLRARRWQHLRHLGRLSKGTADHRPRSRLLVVLAGQAFRRAPVRMDYVAPVRFVPLQMKRARQRSISAGAEQPMAHDDFVHVGADDHVATRRRAKILGPVRACADRRRR
jgi:hypothetical protein